MTFFSLILACTLEGGIGYNNCIPWNIKEELLLFKKITSNTNSNKKNAIIMGKNTWNSLKIKPLKNRINIIITSNPKTINTNDNDIYAFKSFDDGLEFCKKLSDTKINEIYIIGGKSIYDLCLNNNKYLKMIKDVHLSLIKEKYLCDTYIDLKKITKYFKNYYINDIIFNPQFLYVRYHYNSDYNSDYNSEYNS